MFTPSVILRNVWQVASWIATRDGGVVLSYSSLCRFVVCTGSCVWSISEVSSTAVLVLKNMPREEPL